MDWDILLHSFSTPEGAVKGVAPVKFMARKELMARVNIKRARAAAGVSPDPDRPPVSRVAVIPPVIMPLRANPLTGIRGSRAGVITAPEKIPAAIATRAVVPLYHAAAGEKIPGPRPEIKHRATAVIMAGFRVPCISTGIRTSRSVKVNVTCRMAGVAFFIVCKKPGQVIGTDGPVYHSESGTLF